MSVLIFPSFCMVFKTYNTSCVLPKLKTGTTTEPPRLGKMEKPQFEIQLLREISESLLRLEKKKKTHVCTPRTAY
jgi:hypothetical protein